MFKKFLCVVLALFTIAATLPIISVSASEEFVSTDGFMYEVNNGEATILGIKTGVLETLPEELVIPAEVDGIPVTAIDNSAFTESFFGETVTNFFSKLVIPGCVKTIGEYAFDECTKLETLVIEEGVEVIEVGAFQKCESLNDISLPQSLKKVGGFAFDNTAYCENDANWEDGLLYIDNLLYDTEGYGSDVVIKEGTTIIGEYTFGMAFDLESIVFPESLKVISDNTFTHAKLNEVVIPKNVEYIPVGCFDFCADIKGYYVVEENPYFESVDGVLFDEDVKTLIAFPENYQAEDYSMPNSVEVIENIAFKFSKIKNIKLSENLKEIKDSAFEYGEMISVEIPEGTLEIGEKAFSNCFDLAEITMASSVDKIGGFAFSNTAYMSDESNWEDGALYIGTALVSVDDSTKAEEFVVKKGTTAIADLAFYSCEIASIVIPEGVEYFSESSVQICSGLSSISFPYSIKNIEKDSGTVISDMVIYGYNGTCAETWAKAYEDQPYSSVIWVGKTKYFYTDEASDVQVITDTEAELSVKKASTDEVSIIGKEIKAVYELSLVKNNIIVPATDNTVVKIPAENENVYVYAIDENGGASRIDAIYSGNCMTFEIAKLGTFVIAEDGFEVGDVNMDSKLNVRDATAIQKYLAKMIELDETAVSLADFDQSGKVNVKDATAIQKKIAGII